MIADFLQRSKLLNDIERHFLPELNKPLPSYSRRDDTSLPADLDDEAWSHARHALASALAEERKHGSLYSSFDEQRPASAEKAAPLAEVAFFSFSPVLSILQSVLEKYWREQKPQCIGGGRKVASASGDRRSA